MLIATLLVSLVLQDPAETEPEPPRFGVEEVGVAAQVLGLAFTEAELELMLVDVSESLAGFEAMRSRPLENSVAPALFFLPGLRQIATAAEVEPVIFPAPEATHRPDDLTDLAYADIPTLGALLRAREVTCVELTEMFLARLRRLDETLLCVITYTEERALERARELDAELEAGKVRGPLHGIPWVAKDLLAVRGYRTTWGAKPFENQVIDLDAAVVERLDEAGAVLLAKVTLGALAWGDVWFGGKTRNPWDPEQGSSGSSAGSASAVAAGGATFAIGSETLGSIVSPATRCGNSALRPSFGRVSRHGAMTLSWSMDKLGPICRSATDAALVFAAIQGADERDPTSVSLPFEPREPGSVERWRVGYPKASFEDKEEHQRVLRELRSLGVELVPIQVPDYPVSEMTIVLSVEAAAAFDEFSRGGLDDQLVRQERQAWPNVFRHAQLIPAVDYVRANRLRTQLIHDFEAAISGVRAVVHPSYAAGLLTLTNLTGHPTFVAPAGFDEEGRPYSVSFTGHLFGETELMRLAQAWQAATEHHLRHPDL